MRSTRTMVALVAAAAFLTVMSLPNEAEAKRKGFLFFLVQFGDTVFEVDDTPVEETIIGGGTVKRGFKCNVVGLFWAYFHWWGCEGFYVNAEDNSYMTNTPADAQKQIEEKFSPSDGMSFWNKHGRWIYLLALIGFGVMGAMGSKNESVDDDDDDDFQQPQAPPPPQP